MLFHFSGLSFSSNTKNCLDFVKEECIWIIIRKKNEKNLNLAIPGIWTASPNHFCPFNNALWFLQLAVKSSDLTYGGDRSNVAGVFPFFFCLDRFGVDIYFCAKSRCPYLYSKKCRWEINIFFDVASSVQCVCLNGCRHWKCLDMRGCKEPSCL